MVSLHQVSFDGAILDRGFWLYVWEVTTAENKNMYYVGRTGDSSSSNAQSPFNRMGQHLGFNKRGNMLRRRLTALGVDLEGCTFRLVAYGPILEEVPGRDEHRKIRDHIAAMEKALAEAMTTAGYEVINKVNCHTNLDTKAFALVRTAFAGYFEQLIAEATKPSGSVLSEIQSRPRGVA
jgi:choline dehydrogenase-like flavoprotein